MNNAILRVTIQAGMLVRGAIRRKIEDFCFQNDLDCKIQERWGIFESSFNVRVEGQEESLVKLKEFLNQEEKLQATK